MDKKEDANCDGLEEQEQMDVASVFRVIFCSCDVDNADLVPVSKLIEFIQPFMIEDLNALEELRHSLDPENKNALVTSERFYEVMSLWSKKIAATFTTEETEFNRTPSQLQIIDDKELPYTHSTPRASLGDKLLRCKDLLNLSNVSGYSLSTSTLDTTNPADSDKTVLEEEIKKLEHQLSKTANELTITKQQLAAFEEQNETLQQDLDRLNRRLHAEQQVIEHLQKEKVISEESRDELNTCKKLIDDLKKKLSQSEKDSMYYRDVIDEQDKEKLKLEKKKEVVSKQHQDCLKEIFDIKTELETKEQQMTEIIKVYDELKLKFAEQKDFNDQLREENDILSYQKSTLEKALKAKPFNSPLSNLGNLNHDLSTPSPHHGTSVSFHNTPSPHYNTDSSPHHSSQNIIIQPKCSSIPLLKRVLARHSSTPINSSQFILDSSTPDSVKSMPVLSPVNMDRQEKKDQPQDSSEEDLSWKLQQGGDSKIDQELNGTAECLQSEMNKADSMRIRESYCTVLFEKDEQIIELEEELEKVKAYLKKVEDQKNEFLSKLKDQNKINEGLIESNFVLVTKEETSQKKIESLKNRLTQLEKNGVIVENDHENSQAEIEDMRNKVKILEEQVKNKESEITEFKFRADQLKEKLKIAESKVEDDDQKLQAAMRDLSELRMDKAKVEEELGLQNQEKQNTYRTETLTKEQIKQLNQEISEKNKLLKEEELCRFNNSKDQEIARCGDGIKQKTHKFEEKLRLKDEEVKSLQKEKDEELFKENLEKKIVQDYEGEVNYSKEAQETIIDLSKKCKQLEDDLKNTLSKLSSQGRALVGAENRITYLTELGTSLKHEIETLKTAKTELETTVINLKSEQDNSNAKLQKINKIDVVASEIQKHIKDKEVVVEELKQLNSNMKYNLNQAQLDLKEKIDEILKLRKEWTKCIDIKNDLWHQVKSLQKENYRINAENRALLEKERQLSSSNEALNIEYDNLLIAYNLQVNNNYKLNEEMSELLKEKNYYCNGYNELKVDLESKNKDLETIKRYLMEYQSKLGVLESQNQELQDKLAEIRKNGQSQTEGTETDAFEEEFLKIKLESDKLLEELEGKLNEEVDKNRNLTKDLLNLKNHLDNRNTELLEIKEKVTKNETEMMAKLQQHAEKNKILAEELSQTQETLRAKDIELNEFINSVNNMEQELDNLNEKNAMFNQEKCKEIKKMEQNVKDNEEKIQVESGIMELLNKLTDVEKLLEQRQIEIKCIENSNRELITQLDLTKKEKDKVSNDLLETTAEILLLKEHICELRNEKNLLLEQKQIKISDIENRNGKLQDELIRTKQEKELLNNKFYYSASEIIQLKEKHEQLENELVRSKQEKDALNNKLQVATSETIGLKEKLSENEQKKNKLLYEAKQKLQEEVAKNKAIFDTFHLLKKERDQLTLELNDTKTSLADTKALCDKTRIELRDLQVKCSELNSKIQIQTEQLKKSEVLLQDEINKNNLEKSMMNDELLNIKSSLVNANLELNNMETLLSEAKRELSIKCLQNERLMSELEGARRKGPEGTDGSMEKEAYKRKTYSRQQIAFEKLSDRLEDAESQLQLERNKNRELENKLSLSESKIIGDEEGYKKEIERLQDQLMAKEERLEQIDESCIEKIQETAISLQGDPGGTKENQKKCEGKTVNKFTLAVRCQASPDSPSTDIEVNGLDASRKLSFHTKCPFSINCDSTIEIPCLDVVGFADDIIEELDMTEGSPRRKLDMEETEKNFTALTLRLLVNSKDISERIENQTEKYRGRYEEILSLIRDISHRLRDHVCIGTAEPIMPVFVLLEDIKLQLKEVVQSAGQVGVLIYEDRMKKCWNLVTNYMAMLRQENESLRNISRETTPTQTGLIRRKNKCTQDKGDSPEQISYRSRRFLSCTRLTSTLFFMLAIAVTVSIIIHLNCRMTASENQYCPLDGIITRINVGVPPM